MDIPVYASDETWVDGAGGTIVPQVIERYRAAGCAVFREFLGADEVDPVIADLRSLLKLQLAEAGDTAPVEDLETATLRLARGDRARVGALYDTAMKLVSVRALATSYRPRRLVEQLLASRLVAMSNNLQVRIDIPTEDRHLFRHWHQDYTSGMVSEHGVAIWMPLYEVTGEVGPVELLVGSHTRGLLPIHLENGCHFVVDDEEFLARFAPTSVEVVPGDIVVFDLMLVHRSALNRSARPRWTACFRYCDLTHPSSAAAGWPSYYSQGRRFEEVHPNHVVERSN